MAQQQGAFALGLADDVDEVDVEVFDPGRELREAVQVGDGGAPVVAVGPVGAEVTQELRIGPAAPAALDGGDGEGVFAHPAQDVGDGGFVPGDGEWRRRGHGGLPCFPEQAGGDVAAVKLRPSTRPLRGLLRMTKRGGLQKPSSC